jgi:hypothetical protein
MAFDLRAEVVGVDRVRKALTKLDSDIGRGLTKTIRAISNELRDDARSLIPSGAPLSNWQGSGRATPSGLPYWESSGAAKSAIKSIIGAGSRQRGTYQKGAAARVVSSNPAAVVYDVVGKSAGTSTFVDNMQRKHGPKRRALLKAGDKKAPELRDRIDDAVKDAVAEYNRK